MKMGEDYTAFYQEARLKYEDTKQMDLFVFFSFFFFWLG